MRPKTAEQVCARLIWDEWHPGIAFYEGAKDCRSLGPALIRDALAVLRTRADLGQEVRTLVAAITAEDPDEAVEASWRAAIDGLRLLHRTSPVGTPRERSLLMDIARNRVLVRAMISTLSSSPRADPSWLAVLSADGSPESQAMLRRHMPGLAEYPELVRAIATFGGAHSAAQPARPRKPGRKRP